MTYPDVDASVDGTDHSLLGLAMVSFLGTGDMKLSLMTADREYLIGFARIYCGLVVPDDEPTEHLRYRCFRHYKPPGDDEEP